MKPNMPPFLTLVALLLLGAGAATPAHAQAGQQPAKGGRPAIYDVSADGKKQIAAAVAKANKENKRVLLQLGANWCPWCHRLHQLFRTDPAIAASLKQNYIVTLIDVDKEHNADVVEQYEKPTRHGLPVIVVLDSKGKRLTTQDTSKLEEGDHYDTKQVLAFLDKWARPKTQ